MLRTSSRVGGGPLTVLLLLCAAGCASATPPAATPGATASARQSGPTDALGQRIIRPDCLPQTGGVYLHQLTEHHSTTPVYLLGSGPRGVVLGAQANGDICQVLPVAQRIAGKGYHVAIFDWTVSYAEDMRAAARALRAHGARRVVLGGFSRGALVALGVAPNLGASIAGVISVSGGPSASEGFPTIASLARFRGPVLLVSSKNDPVFPPGTSRAIAAAHAPAGANELVIVPGQEHALALLAGPYSRRIQAAIYAFLTRTR
jgi:pimeloyl-ACP methyl ester carboxylesterase